VEERLMLSVQPALALGALAGMFSGVGGLVGVAMLVPATPPEVISGGDGEHRVVPSSEDLSQLGTLQAAVSGAILFWSTLDLLPEAAAGIQIIQVVQCFAIGFVSAWILSRRIRRRAFAPLGPICASDEILVCGIITVVCLSIHNMLEGICICLASYDGVEKGVRLALALSLENIPEGIMIALPLYFATKSFAWAVILALSSGFMEPLGVLLVPVFFRRRMSTEMVCGSLAMISGILTFLCVCEIIPVAIKYTRSASMSQFSISLGVGIFAASIFQPILLFHGRVGIAQ